MHSPAPPSLDTPHPPPPRRHLISPGAFEQLVAAARKERKQACCPLTRAEIGPGVSATELAAFCGTPLDVIGLPRFVESARRADLGHEVASGVLGFDVAAHPDAQSKVARDMTARLEADVALHARRFNGGSVSRCTFARDAGLLARCAPARAGARAQIRALLDALAAQRDADAAFVREALPMLLKRVGSAPPGARPAPRSDSSGDQDLPTDRFLFELRQSAGLECSTSLLRAFALLISSSGDAELRALNPFLSADQAAETLDLVVSAILHTSRVGQINRCAHEARGLLGLLADTNYEADAEGGAEGEPGAEPAAGGEGWAAVAPVGGGEAGGRDTALVEAASAIALKGEALAEQLLTRRHYTVRMTSAGAGGGGGGDAGDGDADRMPLAWYDPRFLLFEFTQNIVLRAAQARRRPPKPRTPPLCSHPLTPSSGLGCLFPCSRSSCPRRSTSRTSATTHSGPGRASLTSRNPLPYFLQVELVHEFIACVRSGTPLVKQMLMGGGKTTVVGPLLALMLGDGRTLVIQTMPQASHGVHGVGLGRG